MSVVAAPLGVAPDTGVGVSRELSGGASGRGRPLVVTSDEELLDELLHVAAAVAVEVTVAADALAAEHWWASAPLVVVGADQLAGLSRGRLPARMGVLVVTSRGGVEGGVPWPAAQALGAEHVVLLPEARTWLGGRFAEHAAVATGPRMRAAVVAFVAGSGGSPSADVAVALALAARRQGSATLLVGRRVSADALADGGGSLRAPARIGGGSLVVLSVDRAAPAGAAPAAMAAALHAGREGRDLVVADLGYGLDEASLLALTCADRAYLVVVAEVRACACASRVVAAVRRHCPDLALLVRSTGPRGLRPAEVATALGLRLAGVVPVQTPLEQGDQAGPVSRLGRTILAGLGLHVGAAPEPGPMVDGQRVTP